MIKFVYLLQIYYNIHRKINLVNFLSAESGRITLKNGQEKDCTVSVQNAKTEDGGTWKFLIGTIHGTNYKEIEQNHQVVISSGGMFV